jgi:hypothetical protein
MQGLADEVYPQADKIVIVMDNLNTHSPASFYETFGPEEARRLINCAFRSSRTVKRSMPHSGRGKELVRIL